MPTQFPRRRCVTCRKYHVSWKMPSFANESGSNRIFFCWSCATRLHEKLTALNILCPPVKSELLKKAFSIKPNLKIENSVEAWASFKSSIE